MTTIDPNETQLRKEFLDITGHDGTLLRKHRHRLFRYASGFVKHFYHHLQRFPPLQRLLDSPELIKRLQGVQRRYYKTLLAGHYDQDYISERLQIGAVHQRVGLESKWYIGAYALYLNHFLPELWRDPDLDPDTCTDLSQAMIKLIFFDMGLAIDTYIDADQQLITSLKVYAERIIESAPCGLVVTTSDLKVLTANPKLMEIMAVTEVQGRSLEEIVPIPGLRQLVESILQTSCKYDLNFEHKRKNHTHLYHIEIAPIELGDLVKDAEKNGLIFSLEDYTEQENLKLVSTQKSAHLSAVSDSIPDGLITFYADGSIESWNPALIELFGYRDRDLQGINIAKLLFRERYQPLFAPQLLQHLWWKKRKRLEAFGQKKDGRLLHLEIAVNQVPHSDPSLYLAVLHDISARKQAEEELNRMAKFDPLTQLPNRHLYMDRLGTELARAHRYQKPLAVLFLDLDDFKKINDSFGHLIGDILLQEVSHRLSDQLRETDTVARFGGDEFAFIIPDLTHPEGWHPIAAKILKSFDQPFQLKGREVFIKASIGASLYPLHGNDPHTLLRNADTAMYRAKFRGHNQVCLYESAMETEVSERVMLESELHRALEREEFQLVYQPKVMLESRRIMGFEVLLRWQNEKLGNVPPDHFISVLENLGLIHAVGNWSLHTALDQVRQWQNHYKRPLQLAINISSHQIRQHDFADQVLEILGKTDFPTSYLELEITETTLMERNDCTLNNISTLKEAGIRLAIDDFGTGYSSLSYLRNFPFDTLKIDRSFIQNLDDERNLVLARHIMGIGHGLGLEIVAEGVEDDHQLEIITDLGCDQVQGYLFFRPLDAREIGRVLDGMPVS